MVNIFNKYLARFENILKEKSKSNFKLKWPILLKRWIDDGFGIMKGNKSDVEYWVIKFYSIC